MPKGDTEAGIGALAISDGERSAEYKRRRDNLIYIKVPHGAEAPYISDGWQNLKSLTRTTRLSKEKAAYKQYEDRVWCLFYRMGYDELNKGANFEIRYIDRGEAKVAKQIDVFAKDGETIVIGECKTADKFRPSNLSKDILEFAGLKGHIANTTRNHYGRNFKPKILWFFFTQNLEWSEADRARAKENNIHVMTERETDYFAQLTDHLGRAARFQFLAEYLGGSKIPELKDVTVPAIRGRLGGHTFYSFVSTPEQLLKICFVNHRTLADPLGAPTYQRLVKRARMRSIGEYIKKGGFFPTNILINFDTKRQFVRRDKDEGANVQFGDLHLPDKYKSAWIIDGQHRLYGYSVIDKRFSSQNLAVIAFEGLKREDEAHLFVTINHEQKTVPRTLLDELDADLKWGSTKPIERLASIASRVVQGLAEANQPLFRRIVSQGLSSDDKACLTVPELKGGVVRAHLVGHLAQKRRMLESGPFSGHDDAATVKRTIQGIGLFLSKVIAANPVRWEAGRPGGLVINVGMRALFMVLAAAIEHLHATKRFKPTDHTPQEIIEEIEPVVAPLLDFMKRTSVPEYAQRFDRMYGSGGPREYFYELAELIHVSLPEFLPDGLKEYLESKDEKRVSQADETIGYIESSLTQIIFEKFRALHGEKYWEYVGNKDMRVKAYERQQEEALEKRLPQLEAYLDLSDKKRIIEKPEVWAWAQPYFDIVIEGEKKFSKNLRWLDRLIELRRIKAHPSAMRRYKREDLEFLEWLRPIYDDKVIRARSA